MIKAVSFGSGTGAKLMSEHMRRTFHFMWELVDFRLPSRHLQPELFTYALEQRKAFSVIRHL